MHTNKANIINALMLATEKEIEEGKNWYLLYRNILKQLSSKYNIPFLNVCGIASALSPFTNWNGCLKDTERFIKYRGKTTVSTFGNNKKKAIEILKLRNAKPKHIVSILRGQKTTRFFLNLYHDKYNVVTIDRHMIALYFGSFEHKFVETPKRMKIIRQEFKDVAKEFNFHPNQLQAITWVVWRRINGIK